MTYLLVFVPFKCFCTDMFFLLPTNFDSFEYVCVQAISIKIYEYLLDIKINLLWTSIDVSRALI